MRSFIDQPWLPEGLMVVEDDVIMCRGVAEYLAASAWPGTKETFGIAMPYCCAAYGRELEPGVLSQWHTEQRGFYLAGFQAVIYRSEFLPQLIARLEESDTSNGIDYEVGKVLDSLHREVWVHVPSLAQHIGIDCSAVGNKDCGTIFRSNTFPGEDFDAMDLLQSEDTSGT
jgi:hypothetical protein